MKISLIVALTRKGVIGKNNSLPWHIPGDLKRFKEITTGHPIIMGRKTYDSIGKPLPNRTNIVISRQKDLKIPGCEVFHDLSSALQFCRANMKTDNAFVIGGAQLFVEALPLATNLHLTWVEQDIEGDVVIENLKLEQFKVSQKLEVKEAPIPHTFCDYERLA
jgi:dihydrofolate reductase